MLIAVNFHYVRLSFESRFEAIHGLTPAEFQRQLETLATIGEFVSADEIRHAVLGKNRLPARAIAVTLDDGLREQYDHAWPVLQRLGVPAIFYLNTAPVLEHRVSTVHKIHLLRSSIAPHAFTDMLRRHAAVAGIELGQPVDDHRASVQYEYDAPEVARLKFLLNLVLTPADRDQLIDSCFAEHFGQEDEIAKALYMTPDQIRTLAAQRLVGAHGHDHVPLGLLPRASAEAQVATCLDSIEKLTAHRPFSLSYPFGERLACSAEAGQAATACGIDFAFTMERAANDDLETPLHLARFDSNDAPGGKRPYWPAEAFFSSAPPARWCRAGESEAALAAGVSARG